MAVIGTGLLGFHFVPDDVWRRCRVVAHLLDSVSVKLTDPALRFGHWAIQLRAHVGALLKGDNPFLYDRGRNEVLRELVALILHLQKLVVVKLVLLVPLTFLRLHLHLELIADILGTRRLGLDSMQEAGMNQGSNVFGPRQIRLLLLLLEDKEVL